MVWKVLSPGSREHTLIGCGSCFSTLYIHLDSEILIIRICGAYIIEMVRGRIIDGLEGSVAWIEGTHPDCLWVLFLDPLYIHRDAKIIIVRVGFLMSAIVKRIGGIFSFSRSTFQSLMGFWLGSFKMSVLLETLDTSMYSLSRWMDSDADFFFD